MSSADFDLADYLERCRQRCGELIRDHLHALTLPSDRLGEAMEYAALLGGKRIRPTLVWASADAFGGATDDTDNAACAVELLHCYSLIHDDLPCMDDDDLRRGRPTVHRAFDETTAVLAGDALQSLACHLLSHGNGDPERDSIRLRMLQTLTRASGAEGMVAGQSLDFEATGNVLDLARLQAIHRLKTGALIRASVRLGALSSTRASSTDLQALDDYAHCIGLAFQVQDDILDVTADTETLGKNQGADQAMNKSTYVSLLGLDGAREKASGLVTEAVDALAPFGSNAEPLAAIARYIIDREF